MIRNIVTDKSFLSMKCLECNVESPVFKLSLTDLLDTANSLKNKCAGLAFNQIGILRRGFVIKIIDSFIPIINPEYLMKSVSKRSREEGCLSCPGKEPIRKRRSVKVKITHYDMETKEIRTSTFHSFEARVAQHEMDHLRGILI